MKLTKMESVVAVPNCENVKFVNCLVTANGQYFKRKYLETSGVSESVEHTELGKLVHQILQSMDATIVYDHIESCHPLKEKRKGRLASSSIEETIHTK